MAWPEVRSHKCALPRPSTPITSLPSGLNVTDIAAFGTDTAAFWLPVRRGAPTG